MINKFLNVLFPELCRWHLPMPEGLRSSARKHNMKNFITNHEAVFTISIFHYREYTIKEAKEYFKPRGER